MSWRDSWVRLAVHPWSDPPPTRRELIGYYVVLWGARVIASAVGAVIVYVFLRFWEAVWR